jgi:hypothetical protein
VTQTVDQYAGEKVSLVVIAEAYVNAAFAQGIVEINYKHLHQATKNVNVKHATIIYMVLKLPYVVYSTTDHVLYRL